MPTDRLIRHKNPSEPCGPHTAALSSVSLLPLPDSLNSHVCHQHPSIHRTGTAAGKFDPCGGVRKAGATATDWLWVSFSLPCREPEDKSVFKPVIFEQLCGVKPQQSQSSSGGSKIKNKTMKNFSPLLNCLNSTHPLVLGRSDGQKSSVSSRRSNNDGRNWCRDVEWDAIKKQ